MDYTQFFFYLQYLLTRRIRAVVVKSFECTLREFSSRWKLSFHMKLRAKMQICKLTVCPPEKVKDTAK